jgi:hypothetical protein
VDAAHGVRHNRGVTSDGPRGPVFEIAVCNLKVRAGDTSTPEPGDAFVAERHASEFGNECGRSPTRAFATRGAKAAARAAFRDYAPDTRIVLCFFDGFIAAPGGPPPHRRRPAVAVTRWKLGARKLCQFAMQAVVEKIGKAA